MTSNWQPATSAAFKQIIATALAEDIGAGDITSQLLIPDTMQAGMHFVAREDMVMSGGFIPAMVYARLGKEITAKTLMEDGQSVKAGQALAAVNGPARAMLAGERVALNLMQRMCGVATLTRSYVDAVSGTKAVILDTRKTMPGLRELDKYAVRCGGGQNHRMGLYDMVLIKDNHIAVGIGNRESGIGEMILKAKKELPSVIPNPQSPIPIVVECDTLEQVEQALRAKPDRILLDNMDLPTLRKAVAMAAGEVKLEASGGVSLDTVRGIAETGVDFISVGKLTHSAQAADIGADIVMRA